MLHAGFSQHRFKGLRRTHGLEHVAPVVAAIDDVIQRAGILNSYFAGHFTKA